MFRENAGRLFTIAAGTGCLVLLIFVALPMMNEPAPSMTEDEIEAEVPGTDEPAGNDSEKLVETVMPAPSPLVGVRNDGEEVAVIFPASEPEIEEPPVAPEEDPAEAIGLPQILSAEDVAEATAALEGLEPGPVGSGGPVGPGGPDSVGGAEGEEVAAPGGPERPEPVSAAFVEDGAAAHVTPPEPEVPAAEPAEVVEPEATPGMEEEDPATAVAASDVEEPEPRSEVAEVAKGLPIERISAAGDREPGIVQRPAVRRSEFDVPVSLHSRAPQEVSHPSGGVPDLAPAEAAQAGNPQSGLPPRMMRPGVIVPGTLRGVMGYRLPLVSRQEVPDQIVSGVLIPAHTTFVILREGAWELVDVSAEELERLRDLAASQKPETAEPEPEKKKGWALLRMFRKRQAPADE